jgi:ribulose bisphosphate carboxylase small subunit
LGIEVVNDRRFRTNSWQSLNSFAGNPAEALHALDEYLAQHPNDYLRLVEITRDRRRLNETIIHRPTRQSLT